jgi:hypothetical protein
VSAGAVVKPETDDAVNGTVLGIAGDAVDGSTADGAAEFGRLTDGASAALGAATTSVGAAGVGRPFGHDAVHRAATLVAGGRLGENLASNAAVGSRHNHRAGMDLGAGTASGRARAPVRPGGELAVDGAGLGVTVLAALELSGAGHAVVGLWSDDNARASLLAGAAHLVACTVGAPGGEDAVDGAGLGVAAVWFGAVLTDSATVGGSSDDGASTSVAASTASRGACGVHRPPREHAADGARMSVASQALSTRATSDPPMVLGADDRARAHLLATAAGEVAGTIIAPWRDNAVNGAGNSVAALGEDHVGGALDAAVSTGSDDRPRNVDRAGAAGLGAGGPLGPL